MILNCPLCNTRVRLDDEKIPAQPFNVRCPRCEGAFAAPPIPGSAVGAVAAAPQPRVFSPPPPAAPSSAPASPSAPPSAPNAPEKTSAPEAAAPGGQGLLRMLAALLQQGGAGELFVGAGVAAKRHRLVVCTTPARRERIARALNGSPQENSPQYDVTFAADTAQAVDSIREERCNVLLLDSDFDAAGRGAAYVNREVSTLTPAQRRRLFIVKLSNAARTADAHEAFINNANLTVNYNDIPKLPQTLERAMRDFNDLYRDFHAAQKASGL